MFPIGLTLTQIVKGQGRSQAYVCTQKRPYRFRKKRPPPQKKKLDKKVEKKERGREQRLKVPLE